jgi:hypothetical protein
MNGGALGPTDGRLLSQNSQAGIAEIHENLSHDSGDNFDILTGHLRTTSQWRCRCTNLLGLINAL